MKTGIALAGVFLAATASAALMHAPAGRAAEAFGVASSVAARGGTDLAAQEYPTTPYNGRFVFTRVRFDDGGSSMSGYFRRGREPWWHHDHPDAEYNFSKILETITYVPPTLQASNILTIEDPRIFQYPILYLVEPGYWRVTEGEIVRLREYLLKGGFIIFDDMDVKDLRRGPDPGGAGQADHRAGARPSTCCCRCSWAATRCSSACPAWRRRCWCTRSRRC
jgi:hypothetical protein